MRRNYKKRPTRRKPSRPNKQHYFSTVADYSAPWYVLLSGATVALLPLAVITLAAYGHLHGWW